MYTQLRETAQELAGVLWREHTVYRERGGGVVIRGEHVDRWISLGPTGGKDQALLRAGRLLDGGTTAPARTEVVVDLTAGTAELATVCRRLLAEVAAAAGPAPGGTAGGEKRGRGAKREKGPKREKPGRAARAARPGRPRKERHTSLGSLIVLLCVAGVFGAWLYSLFGGYGPGY
ncbi:MULTISPECIES: hypothetical protein [unclassified Streptomyces]|uniref:hypothetical protein n=1 Tax=unclassified Streptomyces TaxID=2593676 RepID=UPI0006F7B7B8|nr:MULTISPECIES: hypothetical protein [unclassified Streptomyces]KQX50892.1 hypothetical protein ASD33_12775 [Streptomyces sp. Root1304]KRA85058.1 hypothetical protein ASE09_12780 [Streptomyces sp. Root66D1]